MAEGDGNDQTDEVPPQGGSAAGGSPQEESEALILRRMELEFQERREKAEREAAERKEERARESEERMLKLKLESEERLRKLELETRAGTQTPTGSDSDEGRRPGLDPVTQCAKVLKGLKLPCDADIPLWFDEVERLFVTYGVPESSRVHLVVPALSERVRYMLRGLGDSECNDYEVVKKAVLQELRLSPAEYLDRFAKAAKRNDETWSQFASRVGTQFDYYLKSRKVETKEEVVALMVADRIKNSLSAERLEYVRLREAETWLKPPEIANVLQTFEQAKGRGSAVGRRDQVPPRNTNSGKRMWTCSVCKGEGQHFRLCPKIAEKPGNPGRSAHVQRVIVEDASAGQAQDAGLTSGGQRILVAEVNALGSIDELRKSRLQHVELDCAGKTVTATVDTGSEVTVVRESLVPQDAMQPSGTIRLVPAFGESVSARVVSLPVSLRQAVSVVGSPKVQLICAVTNNLAERLDCLLSREDWELVTKFHPNMGANSTAETFVRSSEDREVGTGAISEPAAAVCEITGETAPEAPAEEIDEAVEVEGPRARLLASQLADDSLKKAWADAKRGKASMFVSDGLLFHRDTIAGAKVTTLVLPSERREEVLLLAHESLCGGHLGPKKTKARIKYSFFWPGLEADVSHHCQTCHGCQIRADRRLSDRVPIVPLTRPDHPFQLVNVDIIGPLDVPSGRGHKYALCMVDLCTRWPEVVCLRSLTATATCEALLTIFSRTGIPELICSDQGTNFTSQLTQSFLERLGCAPRFSTPEHPESNGTVERWNRVLKNMLFHVIEKDPRNWDRLVPFVLWAYREVPHDTTGVAPFRMLYGRNPTGPLAILQHSWTGELPVPGTLKEEPAKYLRQLREQLEVAAEVAGLTANARQGSYAQAYNRTARNKTFSVGEQVLLFDTESKRKTAPRWLGPFTVVAQERQHSYRLDMVEKRTSVVHVNRPRPYYCRVSHVRVVFDEDSEFGDVECAPRFMPPCRSTLPLPIEKLSHLSEREGSEIASVFAKHADLFDGTPGLAAVGQHRIELQGSYEPKRAFPYRVPELLRKEVTHQVDELLELGLVYPVESEHAHPVVCVGKKDGSWRMCIDYRRLNAVTRADAFPMTPPQELILKVGHSRFITVIDLRRGYWQVPVAPESQHLTSFVTHDGQYAWRVMPFGLRNAAATFQRMMNTLLAKHRSYATAYLDDIAVFSSSWEEHLRHVDTILGLLTDARLKASVEKCQVAQGHIKYLGHVVGSGTHGPDPEKLAAIRGLVQPKTKKELRSLLGLCGYYREYVNNYAEVAEPLMSLTKRGVPNPIPWSSEAERAFEQLKESLCSAAALNTPDPHQPYWLFTDASEVGAGACLA
ncbi:LOW QUALITY PROTEIN: uncharacterized protein LOC144180009 [Haemaphysalis longicornis]